jgi:lipoate synthase
MNINRINAQINKHLFNSFIGLTHWLTATKLRNIMGKPLMRGLGGLTLTVKKAKKKGSAIESAEEWQRMFPSKKMVPITKIDSDTVYAEIRSECPYRGSGNVEGCYRMMEYDRKMMEKIGSTFVVVKSQAERGVSYCQIAISQRITGLPVEAKDRIAMAAQH